MSALHVKASIVRNDGSPYPCVCLPIRSVPKNVPYIDWTSPDWEDNGWNKAMREIGLRLSSHGIPCIILEDDMTFNKPTPIPPSPGY